MEINELSYIIRGIIFKVFKALGPGLFETVYIAAIMHELDKAGIPAQEQIPVPIIYDSIEIEVGFKIDILVDNQLILEIKSIKKLEDVHKKQLLTYLRLSNKKLGLLINFNSASLIDKESIIRIIN